MGFFDSYRTMIHGLLYSMKHPELDALLNTFLPFAQTMLREHGEFYPFGAIMTSSGEIRRLNEAAGAADASRAILRASCPSVTYRIAVLAHAHFLSTAKAVAYSWVK
jgi:hypothetical protein